MADINVESVEHNGTLLGRLMDRFYILKLNNSEHIIDLNITYITHSTK